MSNQFGDRLKATREARGLSQADLAERSGLQSSAVSHFENGRRAPSFDNLKKLADALSVSIDYLLGRVEETASSGPTVQKIFRDLSKMTAADQESLAALADVLAKKNSEKKA